MESDDLLDEISFESYKSVFGGIVTKILNYVLIILLARYLQPTRYGVYATGFMIASILLTTSQFGLRSGLTRFVSKAISESREEIIPQLYFSSLVVTVGISLVFSASILIFFTDILYSLVGSEYTNILIIFLFSVPLRVLLTVSMGIFEGFNDNGIRIVIQILRNLIQVGAIIFLAYIGATFELIVISMVAIIGTVAVISVLASMNKLVNIESNFSFGQNKAPVTKMLIYSAPLWLTAITNLGMNWADIFMLSYFSSSDVVGVYQSAFSLSNGFQILLLAFATPFFPMASRLYTASRMDKLERLFKLVTRWNNLVMLPPFIFTFIFSEPIIGLMFGSSYLSGAIIVQVLLIGAFINVLTGNNIVILKSTDKTRVYLIFSLVSFFANITLNVLLVPALQGAGAALATSVSLILLNVCAVWYIYYESGMWAYRPMLPYMKYFASGLIPVLPTLLIHNHINPNIIILSLMYAVTYFLLVYLFNGYTDTDQYVINRTAGKLKKILARRKARY